MGLPGPLARRSASLEPTRRPASRYDLLVLFEKRFHEGLIDGSITLTFRLWSRPQAKAGGRYRTAAGMLDVVSVEKVAVASITDIDAQRAGFGSRERLAAYVAKKSRHDLGPDEEIYRVQLSYGGPLEDTYQAHEADLSDDDVAEIAQHLGGARPAKPARSLDGTHPGADREQPARRRCPVGEPGRA